MSLALTFAAAAGSIGQALADGTQATPGFTFKSAARLVTLNVTVQDARSRYIRGLEPRDFAVYEDGIKQQVRFFDATTIPVDLLLLVDRSTSMADKSVVVRAAARGLIGTLRDCDRGAVLTFSRRVAIAQPFTSDHAALSAALDAGDSSGFTALYGALYIALREFGAGTAVRGAIRRQAIAVLSDGEDNASLVAFEEVVTAARQAGVSIYTIRLKNGGTIDPSMFAASEQSSRADFEMKLLARETGALSFFPTTSQLPAVYTTIGDEIGSQYSLAYEAATAPDGGFRRIAVQVVGNPELRARTRSGYAARAGT